MSYHLTTKYGGTEVVIDDNCGISKFYLIADTLAEVLNVTFLNRVDDAEILDWDFKYNSHLLTLHYSIFNGVSILPNSTNAGQEDNKAVLEVAGFLKRMTY